MDWLVDRMSLSILGVILGLRLRRLLNFLFLKFSSQVIVKDLKGSLTSHMEVHRNARSNEDIVNHLSDAERSNGLVGLSYRIEFDNDGVVGVDF